MKFLSLLIVSFILLFGTIFFYAPLENTQGIVQKIFYIHVASALTMYVGYFIAFVASIAYLFKKNENTFYLSKSSIEVGYLFTCVVLATGPFWAKPIWGAYWTWEPRLTTTFILWLIYSAYLLFQKYLQEHQKRARTFSSIIAIIAFINVPLVHLSVKLWRGVHPSVLRNQEGLPVSMKQVLLFTVFVFLLYFFYLLRKRLYLEKSYQRLLEYKENL